MLTSVKIARRQSEIRQSLTELAANDNPTDEQRSKMDDLDKEYRSNETRYRAALVSEDEERKEAKEDLETRSEKEWAEVMQGFEMRQVALALDEGAALDGQTNEIVTELRSQGGYRGVPVPWESLEVRAGETVSTGTPDPVVTRPIIERLFATSVATRMGGSMINVGVGEVEYPVATSAVTAAWAASEGANVGGSSPYETLDRPLKPDHTLGVQMEITRKAMKQSGAGLEQAIRRDMNGAIEEAMDKAVFLGTGADGQPTGLFEGAAAWGIAVKDWVGDADVDGQGAMWSSLRDQVIEFMKNNAATSPSDVRALIRPELWGTLDNTLWAEGAGITEWDRVKKNLGSVVISHTALDYSADVDSDSKKESSVLLTTNAGGVPPYYVATWGAVDLIRDPYAGASSGKLKLTALATMDVTISRAVQIRIVKGVE